MIAFGVHESGVRFPSGTTTAFTLSVDDVMALAG